MAKLYQVFQIENGNKGIVMRTRTVKMLFTAFPSRAPGFSPVIDGVRVVNIYSFLCWYLLCALFCCCLSSSCVPNIASVSGWYILDFCSFGFL